MQTFQIKPKILVENDLLKGIRHILAGENCASIALLADEHVADHPAVVRCLNGLGTDERKTTLRRIPSGEPTTQLVNQLADEYRDTDVDLFIAIGGGSVMDLTKALSAAVVHADKIEAYQGTGRVLDKGVKKICVPTTAGTGCEVTGAAVLINEETGFKRGVGGAGVGADYALLCAELSVSLPAAMTVGCGFDAIAHAIESYVSKNANPITRLFSKEAFVLLYNALPKVVAQPENLFYREQMLLGSCLAGCAINTASTGAAHGMSYGPGVRFKVPHGYAISLFLPDTMQICVEKGYLGYAELYRAILPTMGDDARDAQAFVECIRDMPVVKAYRPDLESFGATAQMIDALAESSMANTLAYVTNPVSFTLEDSYRVYRNLFQIG